MEKAEIMSKINTNRKELISYLFWGVMTTVVSWGSYSLFIILFNGFDTSLSVFGKTIPLDVFFANVLSWICAVLFAFVTNKIFVFNSRSWGKDIVVSESLKFFSSRIITGLFEIVAVPLLVMIGLDQTVFGIEGMAAKVLTSIAVVILNYIFSKIFVFKQTDK